MNDTNIVGKNIRAARREKGMTQSDLAKKLNVSVMTIRRWETGDRMPKFGDIKKISDAIEVPPIEWMGLDIISPLKEEVAVILTVNGQSRLLKNDEKKILTDLNKLNETGRKEATRQVQNLTEIPRFQDELEKDPD